MKLKYKLMIQGIAVISLIASPVVSLAKGIEEENKIAAEGEGITQEINELVSVINKKYRALNEIDTTITKSKKMIKSAKQDITQTEENIAKRSDYVAKQMQVLQLRGTTKPTLLALLDSKSVSDFFNRAYAISVLSFAQKDKVESLHQDKEKLVRLQESLVNNQENLKEQQEVALFEKEELDNKMSGLKSKLSDNKEVLAKLVSERIDKETKERQERIAKKKVIDKKKHKSDESKDLVKDGEKETSETHNKMTEESNSESETQSSEEITESTESEETTETKPKEPQPTPEPEEKPSTGGMSGQATAYIATGNKTATGTVPQVGRTIAVDPSLIPLGSAVQITVPGAPSYSGVYIAEDTGGVVKGAIIDIFVGSQGEAVSFGRQSITFTIL